MARPGDRGSPSGGMRILIDMNLSPSWVEFFADSGIESVHWRDIGNPTAMDSEIMDYAGANSFVVFTHDLDFGALLVRRHASLPSVIQIRTEDILPGAIGAIVLQAIAA